MKATLNFIFGPAAALEQVYNVDQPKAEELMERAVKMFEQFTDFKDTEQNTKPGSGMQETLVITEREFGHQQLLNIDAEVQGSVSKYDLFYKRSIQITLADLAIPDQIISQVVSVRSMGYGDCVVKPIHSGLLLSVGFSEKDYDNGSQASDAEAEILRIFVKIMRLNQAYIELKKFESTANAGRNRRAESGMREALNKLAMEIL